MSQCRQQLREAFHALTDAEKRANEVIEQLVFADISEGSRSDELVELRRKLWIMIGQYSVADSALDRLGVPQLR